MQGAGRRGTRAAGGRGPRRAPARAVAPSGHRADERPRAEVEQTFEWARGQARVVIGRAQQGAEQLLAAAGLGQEKIAEVAAAIVHSAEQSGEPRPLPPTAAIAGPPASVETPSESEPSEPQS